MLIVEYGCTVFIFVLAFRRPKLFQTKSGKKNCLVHRKWKIFF